MYTVLIVDDEQDERDGVEFLLNRRNLPMTIYKAQNGQEALDFMSKQSIDILITDVKMPIMNGLELCQQVRRTNNNTVILVLSAYGDFEYTQKAIKTRVDDYILKPVNVDEFDSTIDTAIETVALRNANCSEETFLGDNVSEYRREKQIAEWIDMEKRKTDGDLQESRIVNEVIKLVEENYSDNIGLEWVAEKVCLSSGYLSGLFKHSFGKGFNQYLTAYRMEKARHYLVETNIKIVDISTMVGYSNSSYFCLQFKKFYGITANQMREKG